MIGLPSGLATALPDRNRITRELSQGSRSTAYLAEALKLLDLLILRRLRSEPLLTELRQRLLSGAAS
jgi:hypothetical protein